MRSFPLAALAALSLTLSLPLVGALDAVEVEPTPIRVRDSCIGTSSVDNKTGEYECTGIHGTEGGIDCIGNYYRPGYGAKGHCFGVDPRSITAGVACSERLCP